MTTNTEVFRPTHVDSIQFGQTAFTTVEMSSGVTALDTTFAINNTSIIVDLVGTANGSPGTAAPFAKDISYSGNERSVTEENLLGVDTTAAQNQETNVEAASLLEVTMTCVYRNPVPTSLFRTSTKCCLIQMDNEETSSTGVLNIAFNNITVLGTGSLSLNPDGMMEQTVKFSCKGGTNSTVAVTQAAPAETWYKVVGGDYAEEIRTT